MAQRIEDYALLSDCHTAALVGKDGSIDWLCLPRYDSDSAFAALLGTNQHGRWLLAPAGEATLTNREYLGHTFILWSTWTTPTGEVEITEFMSQGNRRADVIRRIRGIRGTVTMAQEVSIRFGYATATPWIRQVRDEDDPRLIAVAGPDSIVLRGPRMAPSDMLHRGEFDVAAGETVDISLTWYPSHRQAPPPVSIDEELEQTTVWWETWASTISYDGPHYDQVLRSLLVLRALTHEDTGGIVAAATTSLPEEFGGTRNWDYRYVWLRDASLTLEVLLDHGFDVEAMNWRGWLLRAIAGDPNDVQIMYGLSGERYLPERVVPQLPGYEGSSPVRVGNGAVDQYQADVIGETMVALQRAREAGVTETEYSWSLQRALLKFIQRNWRRKDQGIWEIRGVPQHFTHSRVMLWAALDRGIQAIDKHGLVGPREAWAELRERLRAEIDEKGVHPEHGGFVQHYGSLETDASLLVLPQVGYCRHDDPRMLATVAHMEESLVRDGLLLRYNTEQGVDGLPPGEHPFLACSFWLVEQYAHSGRLEDAHALMDRLVSFASELGLLSEEYDVATGRQVGNMPQALSHLALVRAADALAAHEQPT
jgi:GH15 family glucan-1,4-alpha-glucosidase